MDMRWQKSLQRNAANDTVIKIFVRQEADLQEVLGRASSLARRSFAARLSGNGG
jgi:hypothetical protein